MNKLRKLQHDLQCRAGGKTANKGFTLVELIIVMAILAALVAILAPQYIKYVQNARDAALEAAAEEIMTIVKADVALEALDNTGTYEITVTGAGPDIPDGLIVADNGMYTDEESFIDYYDLNFDSNATQAQTKYVINIVDGIVDRDDTDWGSKVVADDDDEEEEAPPA